MKRDVKNPIITKGQIVPTRSDFEILGVMNPGVIQFGEEILLLLRVAERPAALDAHHVLSPVFDANSGRVVIQKFPKDNTEFDFSDSRIIRTETHCFLTSMSHIRLARSKDGRHFHIDDHPFIVGDNEYETFGVEDTRVTFLDGTYYINYSAASEAGIVTALAATEDFVHIRKMGNIFHPDNKDVAIFPELIEGLYYALHRPSTSYYGKPEIWIAQSPDLLCWGNHRRIASIRPQQWDGERIGASAVPFRTEHGWLEIYHGATPDNRYCLGAMLLDEKEPWKVMARSERPLVEPEASYETDGFFGNVVFSCGAILQGRNILVYYGAADESVCLLELTLDEVFDHLGM